MNLADWIQKDHEASDRFKMAVSLCRAVAEAGGPLTLDPARVPVSAGECQPEAGRTAPSGRYRAPETTEGHAPTAQAQVYTAGVLCFEILSGRAFEARGGPLLRDVRPDLPRDLCDAVQACLEMDAEWRPKDITYLQGLVEAQLAAGPSASKGASRPVSRPQVASAPAPRLQRRAEPAPRPWPLLLFALVALAVSIGIAVIRLRQPVDAPPVPPVSVAPRVSPSAAAPVSTEPAAPASPVAPPTTEPGHRTAATPLPTPPLARETPAPAPSPSAKVPAKASAAPAAVPSTTVAAGPTPAPVAVAATAPPSTTRAEPPPSTQAPAEPAAPAAVTAVSPPLLRRGSTTLVDVHGVGMRAEHQVRLARGKEAAKGIDVMRQRYVNPTLLQVLLKVDASAAAGGYTLFLVDAAGQATNTRPFEIAK